MNLYSNTEFQPNESTGNNRKSHELSIGTKIGDLGYDFERRNCPNGSVISPNSVAFETVIVVKDTPILSAAEM